MTHITCTFPSASLETDVTIHLLLPSPRTLMGRAAGAFTSPALSVPEGGFPTLYLLHGICDSAETWLSCSGVGHLCDKYGIAAVLPSCGNSFYVDDPEGIRAFSYISEELLSCTRTLFPLSPDRKKTFLGGYSMGAYGAVRTGLILPEKFSRIVSLSGTLDVSFGSRFTKSCGYRMPRFFADPKALADTPYDLFYCLREAVSNKKALPRFYIACGSRDVFLSGTKKFCEAAEGYSLDVTASFTEGSHDWDYWNQALARAFAWLADE